MERGERETCPQCGAEMPVIPGYVTWCDQCDWNLNPNSVSSKERLADKLNRKLGIRAVERLYENVVTKGVAFKITPSIVAAHLAATVLHGLTIILFYFGIKGIFTAHNYGQFLSGIVMTAIAFETRPRIYRVKRRPIARPEYPAIYALLDEMAERTGARKIEGVIALPRFTAFFTHSGLLRKRLVGLGIPLFAGLSLQEKIYVLAHEMAHNAHNDITRHWYVDSAITTISRWHYMLYPKTDYSEYFGPLDTLMAKIRLGLAKPVELLCYLLSLPAWKESQRQEYDADGLAVQMSGTDAGISALEKLHSWPTFNITFEKVAKYKYNNDLFGEFRNAVNHVPEREIERLRRITKNAGYRFDVTHPPTALRKQYIEHCNAVTPALTLDAAREAEIEAEFLRLEKSIQREMLDDYRTWMAPYI